MRFLVCLSLAFILVAAHEVRAGQAEAFDDRPAPVAQPLESEPNAEAIDNREPPIGIAGPGVSVPSKVTAINIPADWMVGVRDLTRGISSAERDPYYQILAHARQMDLATLNSAGREASRRASQEFQDDPKNRGRPFSQFVEIVRHPERYRGKPVALRGYIQRLETFDAGENDEGLKTLHQAYLFTGDSQQSPYVVVSSGIPTGIPHPSKGNPTNDVSVTGYFFKLWSYEAERGRWAAPLILAKTLEWHPTPPPLSARMEFKVALGSGLALFVAVLVALIARQRRGDRAFRARRAVGNEATEKEQLAALQRLEQEP